MDLLLEYPRWVVTVLVLCPVVAIVLAGLFEAAGFFLRVPVANLGRGLRVHKLYRRVLKWKKRKL